MNKIIRNLRFFWWSKMELKILSKISEPSPSVNYNQDCIGFSKTSCWILDGSNEYFLKFKYKNNQNSAELFVTSINDYLIKHIDNINKPISTILRNAILTTKSKMKSSVIQHDIFVYENSHDFVQPSASIIIVRINQDYVELFSIGDCSIYVHDEFQEMVIQNYRAREIKNNLVNRIFNYRKEYENLAFSEFHKEVIVPEMYNDYKAKFLDNRMNAINLDPGTIRKAFQCNLFINYDTKLLLLSDGFSRMINTFNIYNSYIELFNDIIISNSVNQLYTQLREIEARDIDVRKFPRLNVYEDASLIFARITNF